MPHTVHSLPHRWASAVSTTSVEHGLCTTDNTCTLSWIKDKIYITPKLTLASFVMRTVTPLTKIGTLVYLACFHSISSYGVIFWENSKNSKQVFNNQKKIIRTMKIKALWDVVSWKYTDVSEVQPASIIREVKKLRVKDQLKK
jgi:hypothetical protein